MPSKSSSAIVVLRLELELVGKGAEVETGEAREGDWVVLVCEEPLVVERVFGLEGEREEVLEVVDDLDLDDFFLRGGAVVGCV